MWQNVAVVVILLGAAVLIVRRIDVRLVLALGALPLFAMTGRLPEMFGVMAREMGNPKTIVPICSALGFAYVLRLTGCDAHLVQLLLKPLRHVRVLIIPGGVAAGIPGQHGGRQPDRGGVGARSGPDPAPEGRGDVAGNGRGDPPARLLDGG